jgi:hypothetical protein
VAVVLVVARRQTRAQPHPQRRLPCRALRRVKVVHAQQVIALLHVRMIVHVVAVAAVA